MREAGGVVQQRDEPLPAGGDRGRLHLALDGGPRVAQPREPEPLLTSPGLLPAADVPHVPRDAGRRRLLVGADVLGLVTAYLLTWLAVPGSGPLAERAVLLAALPAWLVLNKLLGLYDRDDKVIHRSSLDELPKVLHSIALGALLVHLAAPLLGVADGRGHVAVFLVVAAVALPLLRTGARTVARRLYAPERCVVLGTGPVARVMARKLQSHPEYGVEVAGHLDDETDPVEGLTAPVLGRLSDLHAVCAANGVERVVVAFSSISYDELLELVRTAKQSRLKVTIVPRLYEAIGHSVELDEVEGMTVLSLRGLSRSRSSLAIKRAIDVAVAGTGLLLLLPLLAVIAAAIKLDSRGPVLFRQRRMGAEPFEILKFRSMVDGADAMKADLRHLNEADGVMFKIAADPRVTRVGGFLRRTSLDELPQLWNVLRGEMSLVGPRPLVPDEDSHVMGWHRERLALTPGLTGPWQVAGRTSVPFDEMVKMDYLYVAEWSLWNDLRLLLRTAPVVLLGRGT